MVQRCQWCDLACWVLQALFKKEDQNRVTRVAPYGFYLGKSEIAYYLSNASGVDISVTVPIDKALSPFRRIAPL